MQIRISALLFTALLCMGLMACDEVIFANKAKGRNPIELTGDYYLEITDDNNETEAGIIEVRHMGKSYYSFTHQGEIIFEGEIVVKGNDYFVNRPDSTYEGYWRISTFRIQGDSAYNMLAAFGDEQEDALEVESSFRRYESEAINEDDTRYFVKNRRRETHRAFMALNDQAVTEGEGILFQKISSPESQAEATKQGPLAAIQLSPNPFVGTLHIDLPEAADSRLLLIDLQGKVVSQAAFDGNAYEWSLPQMASGVYLLRWENLQTGRSETLKVVRQ